MTNLYKTLAVDAYLKSVEIIKAEQTNVARMFVRFLASADDDNLMSVIKDRLADVVETDYDNIVVDVYYEHDDQWGIRVVYHDEYDEYTYDVPESQIYEFAYLVCNF